MKIYLAGCGKIGQRLGTLLQKDGHQVVGLKRHQADFDFPVMTVDLSDRDAIATLPLDADVIIFTVTPSEFSEHGYATVYDKVLGNVELCPTIAHTALVYFGLLDWGLWPATGRMG